MPKRSMIDPEILQEITRLATLDYSGAEVHRSIDADPRFAGAYARPSLRTVQTLVRRVRPQDTSGIWMLAEADAETAGFVLDSLTAIMEHDSNPIALTVARAQWVIRLRQARPDLPPLDAWGLALAAFLRERQGGSMRDIEAYLAFAPWRSKAAWKHYLKHAGDAGLVPEVIPGGISTHPQWFANDQEELSPEVNRSLAWQFIIAVIQGVLVGAVEEKS